MFAHRPCWECTEYSVFPNERENAMNKEAIQQEALSRAVNNQTFSNYPAIIQGFLERGIPEGEIRPRENIFTFNAWRALGRTVKRGEKGVKVVTWVPVHSKDEKTGEKKVVGKRPWSATVFHVTQTTELQSA